MTTLPDTYDPSGYVRDPSTPSGWRRVWKAPVQKYIPVNGPDGQPNGTLMPTVPVTEDGQPVATTMEQVAALMELEATTPASDIDKYRAMQIEQAGLTWDEGKQAWQVKSATAGRFVDPETAAKIERMEAAYDVEMSQKIDAKYPVPPTMGHYQARVSALFQWCAERGMRLVTVPMEYSQVTGKGGKFIGPDGVEITTRPVTSELERVTDYFQNIAGSSVPVDRLEIRNSGNMPMASGDLQSLEKWAAVIDLTEHKEAERKRLLEEGQRERAAEHEREMMNTPAGQIAALQRQLASLTGKPVPDSKSRQVMPGITVTMEVNGVPQEVNW